MVSTLGQLHQVRPDLRCHYSNSAFPAATFNFGPQTVLRNHRDTGNAPGTWCSITALGNYDSTKGGHLILFDLGLVIEFPPGSTILIPLGSLHHGNTPVQEGEDRYSLVQYCPGGLLRHVAYGFRLESNLSILEKQYFLGTSKE
jgi:hypothetical protein